MADSRHIFSFIRKWEGGWTNNPRDTGGETNIGVTYKTWCSIFGSDCHDRFMTMSDEDWESCTKSFWVTILGDQIDSQRIADLMFDWVWGSGKYHPEHEVEHILNIAFNAQLAEDGSFGPLAIQSLNSVDEPTLWDDLIKLRYAYLQECVTARPENEEFLHGWNNRMDDLIKFESE